MKKLLPLLFLLMAASLVSEAQFTRYVVRLKNKGGTPFTIGAPQNYLSARAILRRVKQGLVIDSTDLPVTPSYVTQIRNVANVTVLNVSKWLNAVTIQTSSAAAITTISGFPFVQSVTGQAARNAGRPVGDKFEPMEGRELDPQRVDGIAADYYNYGTTSFNEIHLHNGEFLHNVGLRGQTMQIAMLDNGFNNYTATNNDAFDSSNANSQVLGTWDFIANESNVTNDGGHGMMCFSTIVANVPGQFIGKAPKANFWLFQTEDNASEYPIEEFNWVCGAERSDSSGADVISSSLGYMIFDSVELNHTYAQMDGNTTMAAIGADLAAKKGILVFLAAGNEGTNAWHFIITPADGDSIVAVGAVTSAGVVGSFSSYGPSGDGQVKPEVASVGVSALVQFSGFIGPNNGTSFACPNMAGLGTCLWQGFPEVKNMRIVRALKEAGSRATNPDNRIGYGIPNMKAAFTALLVEYATSTSTVTGCQVKVDWLSKDIGAMKYEIERKAPGDPGFSKIGELNPLPGTVLANQGYSFINNLTSGSSGIYSYRIRQIIDTASATFAAAYIDTTTINLTSACIVTGVGNPNPVTKIVSVQPNPVTAGSVTLVVETSYAITNMPIVIYDSKGARVLQINDSKGTGKKIIELPISNLAKGKYYITVLNGTKTIGTAELLKL